MSTEQLVHQSRFELASALRDAKGDEKGLQYSISQQIQSLECDNLTLGGEWVSGSI